MRSVFVTREGIAGGKRDDKDSDFQREGRYGG